MRALRGKKSDGFGMTARMALAVLVFLVVDTRSSGETACTPPVGLTRIVFEPGLRLTGMSFLNSPVVRGTIAGHSTGVLTLSDVSANVGARLQTGAAYYLEVCGGPTGTCWVGDRFDVDVPATQIAANNTISVAVNSSANTLSALPAGSELVGHHISVRPHVTLGQLFGTKGNTVMKGSTVPSNADQVLLLNRQTQAFETYYLLRNASGTVEQWVKVGGGSTNQDALTIPPGTGMIVRRNDSTSVTLTFSGEVRSHAFAQPLVAGDNLVSEPFPDDHTPIERYMSYGNGFTGSTVPSNADQILVYSEAAFQTYYLLRNVAGTIEQWTRIGGGSTNHNSTVLFHGNGAAILRKKVADPNYFVSPNY